MKRLCKIDNWSVISNYNGYTSPELLTMHLQGNISGHAKIEEDELGITSRIVGKNGEFVETYNGTLYELGSPSPEYEKQFPDAKNRLLKSIN